MLMSFQKMSYILFYETLSIPLEELESKKALKVSWHNAAAEEVRVVNLLLNKESTVRDALEALADELPLTEAGAAANAAANASARDAEGERLPRARRLRMMEVFNNRIYKIFNETEEIETINDQYWTIRAEEIAPDELELGQEDKLIHVRHFYREARMQNMTHNFGDPFLLAIGPAETLASVRARIQAKLSLSDDELAKWKLAVVSFGRVEYLTDDNELLRPRFRKNDTFGNWDDYLGLEHAQTPGANRKKHLSRHTYDKPVKIYG